MISKIKSFIDIQIKAKDLFVLGAYTLLIVMVYFSALRQMVS